MEYPAEWKRAANMDTQWADYPMDWAAATIGRIPAGRRVLWVGYAPLMGGYPNGGVAYGLGNPPLTVGYTPGGESYGLSKLR